MYCTMLYEIDTNCGLAPEYHMPWVANTVHIGNTFQYFLKLITRKYKNYLDSILN